MKRLALAWLLLVAGCGGTQHDAGPAPAPDATPAPALDDKTVKDTVAALVDFLATMAAITEQRKDDCDAMAADLDQLFTTTEPLFEFVHQAETDPEANALLAHEVKAHAAEIQSASERAAAGVVACHDNVKMIDVMQKMPEL